MRSNVNLGVIFSRGQICSAGGGGSMSESFDSLDIVDDVDIGRSICPFDEPSDVLRRKRK